MLRCHQWTPSEKPTSLSACSTGQYSRPLKVSLQAVKRTQHQSSSSKPTLSTAASSSTSPANTTQWTGTALAKSSASSPKPATMNHSQMKNYSKAIAHATTSSHYSIKPPTSPVTNSIICSQNPVLLLHL